MNGSRGTAIFAAYDPWDTCLRVVPHSFNYFRAAEKQGLVKFKDSLAISRTLLECCAHLQPRYRGHFSYFFDLPEIKPFMMSAQDEETLLDTENTRGACADIFYGTVPWPLRPRHHLISRTLPNISFQASHAAEPFTAVTDAIEYASWGTWIGLNVSDVCKIVSHLKSAIPPAAPQSYVLPGRRMNIPFFSQGFQGIVVGFFTGIEDHQAELVRTELLQFGQTLADRWSFQRCRYFWENLRAHTEKKQLAQAILQMVSPVSYIIVESGDEKEGYRLREEESYWAGYRKLSPNEIDALRVRPAEIRLDETLVPRCSIIIKLLSEYSMLDRGFTKARVDMLLKGPFGTPVEIRATALALETLKSIKAILENRVLNGSVSIAVSRQIFVIEKVINNYTRGFVTVSNHEVLRYLKTKSSKIPSGYQISSHSEDIEKLLGESAAVERSRNGIQIRWTPE